jgi:inorganic phosphate transporter, PiT family
MIDFIIIISIILLSYANGGNDLSKGIATLVGSGITSYKKAMLWGTVCTIVGGIVAAVFATSLVKTFSAGGLLKSTVNLNQWFQIAVCTGAFVWLSLATKTGIPVSTTHSTTGAISGAGIAAVGFSGVIWPALGQKIFLPLAFSPLSALLVAWAFSPVLKTLFSRAEKYCVCVETRKSVILKPVIEKSTSLVSSSHISYDPANLLVAEKSKCQETTSPTMRFEVMDLFHWLSAGLASFARGLNDSPKIVALALGVSTIGINDSLTSSFLLVSIAMGIGSLISGLKVTETLSEKVTPMTPQEGFSANLTTSILVSFASRFGLPVSTTHVSSGAIIGIGITHGKRTVRWRVVYEMILAWLVTLPISAIIAYIVYSIFGQ